MAGIKIKRNDTVEVIAGKDKGKRGRVLRVIADKNRVLVEHVMIVKKHVKPNPQRTSRGGIAEQERRSTSRTSCWSMARVTNPHRFGLMVIRSSFLEDVRNAIVEKKSKK